MVTFDGLKDFDVSALGRDSQPASGKPCQLPVTRIECDPDNIRKSFDEAAVIQLAETIQANGLLQAITVRRRSEKSGYFIISYGERRYRAVCSLGWPTIAAVIDDDFDPYRQAIENLQREELDPLDIADWVQKRESAGDSRTLIASRLGKPKSYISEIALLIQAPPIIREAFRRRRIPDIRTAYLLARQYEQDPAASLAWLDGDTPLTRHAVTQAVVKAPRTRDLPDEERSRPPEGSEPWNALAVEVAGRDATLALKPGLRPTLARVRFADGSHETVALSKIKLKHWRAL